MAGLGAALVAPLALAACGAAQGPRSYLLVAVGHEAQVGGAWARHECHVVSYALDEGGLLGTALSDLVLPDAFVSAIVSVPAAHSLHVMQRGRLVTLSVDPREGRLSLVGDRETKANTIHPTARFIYWATRSTIEGSAMDPRTGTIGQSLPSSPYVWSQGQGTPDQMEFSPSGRFLWLHATRQYKDEGLLSFSVQLDTGAPAFSGALAVYDRRSNLGSEGRERAAYLIEQSGLGRWRGRAFGIESSNGALSERPGLPWTQEGYGRLYGTPNGRWLLAAKAGGIDVFELGADGVPSFRHAFAYGSDPIHFAQAGSYLYLWNPTHKNGLAVAHLDDATGVLDLRQEVTLPTGESVDFAVTAQFSE